MSLECDFGNSTFYSNNPQNQNLIKTYYICLVHGLLYIENLKQNSDKDDELD